MNPLKMNEFEEIDELVARVLENMRERIVDHQLEYEREQRRKYGSDDEGLIRLMVAKELARQEGIFLVRAMTIVVTPDIMKRIPAVYFRVLHTVKDKRAPHLRRNKWVAVKRKSYAELKAQKKQLEEAAHRRLERDLKRGEPLVPLPPIPPVQTPANSPKPLQTFFAGIMDETDPYRQ